MIEVVGDLMSDFISMYSKLVLHTIIEKITFLQRKKYKNGSLSKIEELYLKKYEDLLYEKYNEIGKIIGEEF